MDNAAADMRLGRGLSDRVAVQRVIGFAQRFGEAHVALACHAAFPLALTPDMLYAVWKEFVPQAPWTAVADVLLSNLCQEVGHELYEMDSAVRNLLLKELKDNPDYGEQRLDRLSNFVLGYVGEQLHSSNPDARDLAEAQRWTALAYTHPRQVADELAQALAQQLEVAAGQVSGSGKAALLRLASLGATLAQPLADFKPLLRLTRQAATLARKARDERVKAVATPYVSLAAQRRSLVGRLAELHYLANAMKTGGIVMLEGDAGIGKTALLEEAGRLASEQGLLVPPMVDFTDMRIHNALSLETCLVDGLDSGRQAFRQYWEHLRRGGGTAWENLEHLLLEGYQTLAADRKILLRFDGLESLEYEADSEDVQVDCEISLPIAPGLYWLSRLITNLPNTTVLLASRPTPGGVLRRSLMDMGCDFKLIAIQGFTLDETWAYLSATEVGEQILGESPEIMEAVHRLTDGRPLLTALALAWLARGVWDSGSFDSIRRDSTGSDQAKLWFRMALVDAIRYMRTPLDQAVRYVALCRKGCNAELLRRLMQAGGHEVGQEEAEYLVEQLLAFSFVKPPRPGNRGMFFLHDEMYDLVERGVWLAEWPDYREQARLDHVIVDWYTEQIEAYARRIREARDWQERGPLRREQQLLIAERLYYQFDADPRLGYREYSRLIEEAIAQRELEWDTWLHNEALWFMSHRAWRRGDPSNQPSDYPKRDPAWIEGGIAVRNPTVDHDSRRRWVSRYIARNEFSKAVRIAEKLLGRSPLSGEPELYRPGLLIALATTQAYLSGEHIDAAVAHFEKGLDALSAVPVEHREPWLSPYLSGSAHLYRGLALRGKLSLDQARDAYSQAIRFFRQINYRPGLAEAANNLAYILARQGRLEPALSTGNEALHIRQALGDEYGIGLSLNTVGVIHERMAHPITAIARSEQALTIFREIGTTRGVTLALINLGRAFRRKARSLEWGQQDSDFEEGERYLKEAIEIGQGPDRDEFYLVEAHNELGCLYRDWVATLYEKGEQNDRVSGLLDSAERYLNHAVELTDSEDFEGMPHVVQHVDSLEDLARVHYWRACLQIPCQEGDPVAIMTGQLDRAETLARRYVQGQEEIKLVLGKIHFQRARLARLQDRPVAEIGKYYGLAAGYTESYSLDSPEAHRFATDAYEWLDEMLPDEVRQAIEAMGKALQSEGLRAPRLSDIVKNMVRPGLDVGWPTERDQDSHG